MQTDCSDTQLVFEGFAGRKVVADFNGGAVTSNGGALLLREADRAIGLTAMVARCFRDGRARQDVVHTIETLVAQRVHGIALGYEDLNDHDELRHDPVLGLLSDTLAPKRANVAALAGKSTLNRLETAAETGDRRYHKISVDEAAMAEVFLGFYIAALASRPSASSSTWTPPTIPCTGLRRAVSSTATMAATATCRFTSSTAVTCWWPN
jgi:phage tail sheath gpL-like